jgi:hypothetical protein
MTRASQPRATAPATGNGMSAEPPTIDDLAFSLVAALRRHPHLSNVLTHISRSSWPRVEQTLRTILDVKTQQRDLTPLARNMLDLICAERGDTGRIFKPYFNYLLTALAGPHVAPGLFAHIVHLAQSGDEPVHEIAAFRLTGAAIPTTTGVAIHA